MPEKYIHIVNVKQSQKVCKKIIKRESEDSIINVNKIEVADENFTKIIKIKHLNKRKEIKLNLMHKNRAEPYKKSSISLTFSYSFIY